MSGVQVSSSPNFTGAALVPESVKVTTTPSGTTTIECSVQTTAGRTVPVKYTVPALYEGTSATWQIDDRTCSVRDIVGRGHLEDLIRPYLMHR